jgi:hypothetical protein
MTETLEEQVSRKSRTPESAYASYLMDHGKPVFNVMCSSGYVVHDGRTMTTSEHYLARVYRERDSYYLVRPRIEIAHTFLYADADPDDTGSAVCVPWSWDLSGADKDKTGRFFMRCAHGTYTSSPSRIAQSITNELDHVRNGGTFDKRIFVSRAISAKRHAEFRAAEEARELKERIYGD